ncbi:unnamed protein product [Mytilus edulis]|uniref:Uncharacterized protein n=1 Tax=Mytilus edulis TaxID=6550 RepID=A0A8S3VC36_MYTED|nr:unnamed protein product [Mytilus edulis]
MEKDRLLKAIVKREIKLVKLLIDGGVDVNCRGYDGKTPLLVACSFVPEDKDSDSLLSLVGRLIRGGANPNVQDPLGRTPLMYAVRFSLSTDIIKLLLDSGADPNVNDKYGRNIAFYTKRKYWMKYRRIFKEHVGVESSFCRHDIEKVGRCSRVPFSFTDLNELNGSLTTSNIIENEQQADDGDDIFQRMSEQNKLYRTKHLSNLQNRRCKSYVRKSCEEYNLIPAEYENERKASRSCNELCLRGCQTHQLYRDIQKNFYLNANINRIQDVTTPIIQSLAKNIHLKKQ